MTFDRASTFGRWLLRLGGLALVVGAVLALGWLGWRWQSTAPVHDIVVTGTRHAPPDTVRRLARVDTGTVMSQVDPTLVADRIARHPWIKTADVTPQRLRRTLRIDVAERTPAGLVVDRQGRPAYYLDPTGHAMPLPDSAGYDVPIVRGLDNEFHPVRRLAPPSLRRLFVALSDTDTGPLVTEVVLQPDSTVELVTRPVGEYGTVPVRLGRNDFSEKLRTLRAFSRQVLAREQQPDSSAGGAWPEGPIAEIDLRFEGQVITREQPLDG